MLKGSNITLLGLYLPLFQEGCCLFHYKAKFIYHQISITIQREIRASGFSHDLLTCVTSSSFSQAALLPGWASGMWGEALRWSLCPFGLMQTIQGCTCSLQLSPGTFPFPGLAGSVPAGQEFLLSFLPWLWLIEAMDSRCSSVQQCWKAALADGHRSLLQFQLMDSPVTGCSG